MTGGETTSVRVTASPQTVAAFVAFLREHDGTALRLVHVSPPRARRDGTAVSVYAEVVMLTTAP